MLLIVVSAFICFSSFWLKEGFLTASTHLIAGAVSGLLIQNSLPSLGLIGRGSAGFSLGVASHLFLDALPHEKYPVQGYGLGLVLLGELIFVFASIFILPRNFNANLVIFTAMLGAALPDLFHLLYDYIIEWDWLIATNQVIHTFHGKIYLGFRFSFLFQLLAAVAGVLAIRSCRL